VLAVINQARSAAGLPPLTVTAGLESSASAHNLRMADGCGLTHQCPGEPAIGARETAAGVNWTAAGENIGEGGPEPDTTAEHPEQHLHPHRHRRLPRQLRHRLDDPGLLQLTTGVPGNVIACC
jgi:hypothetical protein